MSKLHINITNAVVKTLVDHPNLTAKDIADYFREAAKGMDVCNAFKLSGANLIAAIQQEAST